MALSELDAMEKAYAVLQELDPAARVRALHWLGAALGDSEVQPQVADVETPTTAGAVPAMEDGAAGATTARSRVRPRRAAAANAKVPAGARQRSQRKRAPVAAETTETTERAYRRMPPADEVLAAYREVGTVSGLAEYFGVPRHTVQGWARRLRNEGQDIGRGA